MHQTVSPKTGADCHRKSCANAEAVSGPDQEEAEERQHHVAVIRVSSPWSSGVGGTVPTGVEQGDWGGWLRASPHLHSLSLGAATLTTKSRGKPPPPQHQLALIGMVGWGWTYVYVFKG